MFKLFKSKNKDLSLYAPVTGKVIRLDQVNDKMFASKIMGDGVAFVFDDNIVCAPCDGQLTLIANTLHAFGVKMSNGAEVLVHIGLDTVNLNGEGFKKLAKTGMNVKKGTPIIEIDRTFMKSKNIDLTMPLVITNTADYSFEVFDEIECSTGVTKVIEFK